MSGETGRKVGAAEDGAVGGRGDRARDGERHHSHKRHRSLGEKEGGDIKNAGDLKPEELSAGWRMKHSERKGRAYYYKLGREKEITWKRSDVMADVKSGMARSKADRHHKERKSVSSSKRGGADDELAPPAIPLPPKPPGV